jgi:hypothetical protein
MRKSLFILALLLVVCLFGCPTATTTDPIVHKWNLTSGTLDGGAQPLSFFGFTSFTMTADNNGTWSGVQVPSPVGPSANVSGTWSLSGSTYTIAQTSPTALSLGTATLSGNIMTQTIPNTPSGHTTVLTWTEQ